MPFTVDQILIMASMPNLPDYLGVSRVQTESSDLPYETRTKQIKAHKKIFFDMCWPIFVFFFGGGVGGELFLYLMNFFKI